MENELIESKAGMSFHLDGESEIDATLLSHMISDMVEYTKIMAREVNPDAYLKMNVTAFKNGSFEVLFSAVCQAAETLFTDVGVAATTAGAVIAAVKGGIEIKKLLRGKPAKSVNDLPEGHISVEAQDGEKVTVPSASKVVMYNIQADQLITNISNYAKAHNPNGGFTVADESGCVYCSPFDISEMAKPSDITETTTCQRSRVDADLLIRKPDLEGASKWGFTYNGRLINASIDDDVFLEWFKSHGTINRGDHIHVTLEIYVDIDPQGNPIKGTEKYTIIKVHGEILRDIESDQGRLI